MACKHLFKTHCGCPPEAIQEPRIGIPSRLNTDDVTEFVAAEGWGHIVLPLEVPKHVELAAPEHVEVEAAEVPVLEPQPEIQEPVPTPSRRRGPRGPQSPWARRAAGIADPDDDPPPRTMADAIAELGSTPEGCERLEKYLAAEHARASFPEFFRQAWKVVEPSTELVWNWHHQLLCTLLQVLFMDWLRTKRERRHVNLIRNVLVNIPPGTSKSKIMAVAFQAWCWLHWPGMKFICLSINDDAMMRDARDTRALVTSEWYRSSFGVDWGIKKDQDAVSDYGNTRGGSRLSMAAKSEIVGMRGDCLSGDTTVLTATGDVPIRDLHERWQYGIPVPRVWAMNHETSSLELKDIQATRKITANSLVTISTPDGHSILCTSDHRLWECDSKSYAPAHSLAGRSLLVLPRASARESKVQEFGVSDHTPVADMCGMQHGIRAPAFDPCTVNPQGSRRPVLQQLMPTRREWEVNCQGGDVCRLPNRIQALCNSRNSELLFAEVPRRVHERQVEGAQGQAVCSLRSDDAGDQQSTGVLQPLLYESILLDQDGRERQFNLQGSEPLFPKLVRKVLESLGRTDPSSGRANLHPVCSDGRGSRVECASHRPQPAEQRSREPDHALPVLPPVASQRRRAVARVQHDQAQESGSVPVCVYDIQVEGLHNFFANGVLSSNCLIADDLNNPKRAEQKRERDEVNDTWDTNQYNRVNDLQRSMRLAVQQRTNAGDHSGHVLETDGIWAVEHGEKPLRGPNGWLHVVLPAEFELERKFVMPPELAALMRQYLPEEEIIFEDPRTVEGETLDEVRMPLSVLEAERRRWAGTGNYAGQMQQRPQLVAGGMVQRSYFNFFRLAAGVRDEVDAVETGRPRPVHCHDGAAQVIHAAPLQPSKWDFDWITISIDPASKKTDKGSNYGILVVAGKGGRRYILDDRTQRGHLHEIFAVIKELILLWEPDSILIEPKAAGDSVMDALREAMGEGDLPMVTIDDDCDPGNADKEMRLDSVLSYFKNGMVYVLDGATWLEAFIEELTLFPNGTRDDRVDAVSQILGHVRSADGGGLPDW